MNTPYFLTSTVIALCALSYVWIVLFGALRRDNFRNDIRRLRDELFDHMWKNEIPFDSPEYIEARQVLNGCLRMSNRVTVLSFLIRVHFSTQSERATKLIESLENTDRDALQAKIHEVLDGAVVRLLHFVFLEGSTGIAVRAILLVFVLLNKLSELKQMARREARIMLFDAYMLGAPAHSPR